MPEQLLDEFFTLPLPMGLSFAFFWGAIWGSFLNVVIYRLPRGLSLVRPGSRCPSCETPIKAYDNVPILSWLILRGRCRSCKAGISPRYPLVELLTALLSMGVWARFMVFGGQAPFAANLAAYMAYFAFAAALVAIFFIDLDLQVVPDAITYSGIVAGFLVSLLLADLLWWESLLGIVLGGGFVLTLRFGYRLLRGQWGMGLGDATLLAMIGAFLGYHSLLFVVLAASVLGLLGAMVLGLRRKVTGRSEQLFDPASLQEESLDVDLAPGEAPPAGEPADDDAPLHRAAIAFGPYLAAAALIYLLVGEQLTTWYVNGVTAIVLKLSGS